MGRPSSAGGASNTHGTERQAAQGVSEVTVTIGAGTLRIGSRPHAPEKAARHDVVPTLAGPAPAPRPRGRRVPTAERTASTLQRYDSLPGNVRGRCHRLARVVRQSG